MFPVRNVQWFFSFLFYYHKASVTRMMRISFYTVFAICFILLYLIRIRDKEKCGSFQHMVLGKIDMQNKCLIDYIRDFKVFPPSNQPYNLTTRIDSYHRSFDSPNSTLSLIQEKDAPWVQALIAVELFVPKVSQRKFLECGALDGIMFSTKLYMERFLNWTGVLVEPDIRYYSDMKRTHRKPYGVHSYLSLEQHPTITDFKTSPVLHKVEGNNKPLVNPALGHMLNENMIGEAKEMQNSIMGDLVQAQCFPVYSILLAVNITRLDLFILDVEGVELEILKTLPFDSVEIAVFLIEINGKTEEWRNTTHKFMNSKGYVYYDTFRNYMHPGDHIFIRNKYYNLVEEKKR